MPEEQARRGWLVGRETVNIDAKGRVLIGRKRRERLGESFVLAFTPRGALAAYPYDIWDEMVHEILAASQFNLGREYLSRTIMGSAEEDIACDPEGRFVVPKRFRELARLEREIELIGCGDRLEIWSRHEFDFYNRDPEAYQKDRFEAIRRAYATLKADPRQEGTLAA